MGKAGLVPAFLMRAATHLRAVRDLFETSPIAGLELQGEIVSQVEEAALLEHCRALDVSPFQFQGWEGKRLTRSFGWRYDFDRGAIVEAEPIPDWLLAVRERAAAGFGRDLATFVQALVIRYDEGAGIGWHRDRPQFGEVIGVSLGGSTVMNFRRRRPDGRFDRVKLPLEPRSAYLLAGPVRSEWQHGITAHERLRFSLTFRTLR